MSNMQFIDNAESVVIATDGIIVTDRYGDDSFFSGTVARIMYDYGKFKVYLHYPIETVITTKQLFIEDN